MVQGDRAIQGDCDTGWKHDEMIHFFLIVSLEMSWSRVCVNLAHHSRFFAWRKSLRVEVVVYLVAVRKVKVKIFSPFAAPTAWP